MTPRSPIFPREAFDWRGVERLPAWRALALSAVAAGALVGVPLRLFRAWALTHDANGVAGGAAVSPGYLAATLGVSFVVLAGACALHLAHFPVRRWPARVLAFAAAEAGAEILVSAVLVALGREPLGTTGVAQWADLPTMAAVVIVSRLLVLGLFALVLAGIVQLVRGQLARRSRHHLAVEHGQVVAEGRREH